MMIEDIDTLVGQTSVFITSAGESLATISEKLAAYSVLVQQVVGTTPTVSTPGNDSINANAFHIKDVFASALVSGAVVSVINTTFETKPDAIEAAELLLGVFSTLQDWRDANYEALLEIDTGRAYQKLQEAVSLTAGYLVETSFSLKQERIVTLDRDRTIIDLASELYGAIDEKLDFLISSNSLTGADIIELPKGREIKYYV